MGRMADLLRNAERVRFNPDATVTAVADVVATRASQQEPEPERDDDEECTIPFIEVGDIHQPAIRLARPAEGPAPVPPSPIDDTPPPPTEPAFGGIIKVRFFPVHAGKVSGRGFGPELIAFHQPEHVVSVQYRSLIAEITAQLPGSQPRALVFAAAAPEAGASTVMLNLAVTLARQEATRVVVVDAHLNRPTVAAKLGVSARPGLREVLARVTPLAWSLQETLQPNLLALSGGQSTTTWTDDDLVGCMELLRGRADWVLVDAGPWEGSGTAATLAGACDAVYLVQRDGANDTTLLQAAILEATGRLRGCVITHA